MAVEIDTATDYLDLLDRLEAFLTTDVSPVWVTDLWDDTNLVMHGPGLASEDEIYIGAQAYANAGSDYYGWTLQGFTGYTAGQVFNQPGKISATPPILPLWDSTIPYWFVANGRRVVIVAQVSTVYVAAHLGLLKPYGSPGQFQYPLAIGGTGTGYASYRFSATGPDASQFIDPGAGGLADQTTRTALQVLFGSWLGMRNFYHNTGLYSRTDRFVWPFSNQSSRIDTPYARSGGVGDYVQAPDGTPVLTPLVVGTTSPSKEVFGELEGCFHVSGQGMAAGDIVTVDSVDHLVVQNLYRTGRSDYWALALE